MWISFFYISENPSKARYKLVLVMNRDEFFKRPTSRSDWQGNILAGRDQFPGKEGGTWLAMNKKGHLGILTNIYTGVPKSGKGRGFLITDYLNQEEDGNWKNPNDYLTELSHSKVLYSPFNIVIFEPKKDLHGGYEGQYFCKGHPSCYVKDSIGPEKLEPGFHGVSNHPKNCPYKKTQAGMEAFQETLEKYGGNSLNQKKDNEKEILIEELFKTMGNCSSYHPDEQMIKQGGEDSPFLKFHSQLACINVKIPEQGYGTRVTTLILVDWNNQVTYIEKSRETDDSTEEPKIFQFEI